MPSLLTKILHPSASSSKRNPYANTNHPSHPRSSQPAPAPAPAAQQVFARPASPREQRDFLAEAREVLGRDPVTGRRGGGGYAVEEAGRGVAGREADHLALAEAREVLGRDRMAGRLYTHTQPQPSSSSSAPHHQELTEVDVQREREREQERTTYEETRARRKQVAGTKYDLFVQEMRGRRGGGWRAPGAGFYAPERRVGEYYGPGGGGIER